MSERKLKTQVALFIIILNVAVLSLVNICFYKGGFDPDEFTTVLAVVGPMFACYTIAAMRYLVNERYIREGNSPRVTMSYAILSFAVPSAFAVAIAGALLLQARGGINGSGFTNFEQFKRILLILETAFSAYIGQLIYTMFADPGAQPDAEVTLLAEAIPERRSEG